MHKSPSPPPKSHAMQHNQTLAAHNNPSNTPTPNSINSKKEGIMKEEDKSTVGEENEKKEISIDAGSLEEGKSEDQVRMEDYDKDISDLFEDYITVSSRIRHLKEREQEESTMEKEGIKETKIQKPAEEMAPPTPPQSPMPSRFIHCWLP